MTVFNERTGKLQTGLTCYHKFNSDTLHLISTGIQDNMAQLIEDLETASKKYKGTYSIGSKTDVSKTRRKKEDKKKQEKGTLWLWKIERLELLLFFTEGTPVEVYQEEQRDQENKRLLDGGHVFNSGFNPIMQLNTNKRHAYFTQNYTS